MPDESNPQSEFEPYQWRAHGVSEVLFTNGVFHVRTHQKKGVPESGEVLRRLLEEPDGPAQMPRREALDYEPLKARTLPNALARIAVTCDRESERNRLRRRQLRQHYLAAGKAHDEAAWRAEGSAGQEAERAAIKEITYFYRRYGDLGFQLLKDKESFWPDSGEPLGWIIAEAKTVSFTLALIDALNRQDLRDLKATLASRRLPDLPTRGERRKRKLVRYAVCRDAPRHHGRTLGPETGAWPQSDVAWYDPTALYRLQGDDEASLFDHAGGIAADVVRHHLPGQEYGFFWREGHFVEAPARGPLLRAVWLHVRNTAVDRAEVRTCRECGAPFLVTDRRQRFCPSMEAGGKSRCLARRQMRASAP